MPTFKETSAREKGKLHFESVSCKEMCKLCFLLHWSDKAWLFLNHFNTMVYSSAYFSLSNLSYLYPWDFNLWRWLSDHMERLIPLEEFLLLRVSKRREHATQMQSHRQSTRFCSGGRRKSKGKAFIGIHSGKARQAG